MSNIALVFFFCVGPFAWWVVRSRPQSEWKTLLLFAACAGLAPGLGVAIYALATNNRDLLLTWLLIGLWAAAWFFATSLHLDRIAGD
jgi:hypothetical protein